MECVKLKKYYKDVKDYYYLCPCGRIYSTKGKGKILKNAIDKDSQVMIKLRCDNNKPKNFMLKILMQDIYKVDKLNGNLPSINNFY